jgi:S1-C subfamily serine protease
MVILAGSGHIAYGSGIPRRLVRRVPVSTAIVLSDWEGELGPEIGDYLLFPQRRDLPAAGRIGALLYDDEDGLRIRSCTSGSPCETAGLRPGDRIASIEGQPVADLADLKVALWDKSPGDAITLEVIRKRWLSGARQLTREIPLQ